MSNFCFDTGGEGGHLFRLICLVVLWGGRNTANKYHWCVWGVPTVTGPWWVDPIHGVYAFSVYTAQVPGCSAGERSKVGPGFCAFLRSKLFMFSFLSIPQRHRLSWACILCSSQARAAQATRCLASAHSPGEVRLITSPSQPLGFLGAQLRLRCAVCLFWGADL